VPLLPIPNDGPELLAAVRDARTIHAAVSKQWTTARDALLVGTKGLRSAGIFCAFQSQLAEGVWPLSQTLGAWKAADGGVPESRVPEAPADYLESLFDVPEWVAVETVTTVPAELVAWRNRQTWSLDLIRLLCPFLDEYPDPELWEAQNGKGRDFYSPFTDPVSEWLRAESARATWNRLDKRNETRLWAVWRDFLLPYALIEYQRIAKEVNPFLESSAEALARLEESITGTTGKAQRDQLTKGAPSWA